ncbi:MAG: D-alanyl-D-alanine carboxypeptidase [Lachnospiraceae bacterium]|nr:D-alanyl-D-alanine carboxypeptidase [Lachnospiraceae bacterium]
MPAFSFYSFSLAVWPAECYVASEGACLMDASSGVILFEKNAHEPYYPASITKVLTALITIENCENLSEQVTFSYDAVHIEEENSTIIGASEGDRLSVLDCLYCLLFQSANEVANALAEHVGAKHPELKGEGESDRDVFVKMMNLKAEELGCLGSHFHNPSGLTDENHYTTAYDMCQIMAAAIRNQTFLDIEAHTYWTHAPIRRYPDANDPWNTVYPKHLMLKRNSSQFYRGAIAGKTGYTMNAGNTLVTACEKDGMTLVACVLNAHANHYNDTRRLFDFGYDNFSSLKVTDYENTNGLIEKDFEVAGIPVMDSFTIGIDEDTRITIPKAGSYVEVEKTLSTENVQASGALAEMIYTYGDRKAGSAALRLIPLGGSVSTLSAIEEDPLLGTLLGIELPTETEAEEAADESSTEEGGLAKTEEAEASGSGEEGEAATAGTETGQDDEATEASMEDTVQPDSGEDNVNETEAEQPGLIGRIKGLLAGKTRTIAAVAGGIIGLGALWIAFRAVTESKEARERAKRREKRLQRTRDMTGSQQIEMDLKVQGRLRKNQRKRKR